jgi:prephenate dehydrogenase
VRWNKIALVGVGLLGGSLGLALKQRRLVGEVVGFVRRAASISESEAKGALDRATLDLATAVQDAEVVVLCTPIAQMRALTEQMRPWLNPGAIVTDVGSVKASIVSDLEPVLADAGAHFIGSHPMAGAEKTGVAAAQPNLFVDAVCVVTPTPKSDSESLAKIEGLWQSVGARLLRLSAEAHDELVSRSSHLPHVVAAELTNLVLSPEHRVEQASLCANGFRDTTRIASGSPEMWRDIALANRENLSRALARLMADLREFDQALRLKDEKTIMTFFENAKQRRDAWSAKAASPSPE